MSCLTLCNPARLLCPWDSPGKNTGVSCHALLQEIFPSQGLNPRLLCLLHWQTGTTSATCGPLSVLTWQVWGEFLTSSPVIPMLPVHGPHSENQGARKHRFWWLCSGFLLILCDSGAHADALEIESTSLMGGLVQAVISSMFPHCLLFAGQCCQQSGY